MVLKDLRDVENVVQIYKKLFEARKKRVEVLSANEFYISIERGWAKCKIPESIGKPLMRDHYDKYIQGLERELLDLGFTPDVNEPQEEIA
jgi:hypothetical protein